MIEFKYKPESATVWKNVSEGVHTAKIVDFLEPFEAEDMKGNKYQATKAVLETDEYYDESNKRRLTVRTKNLRLDSFHPKSNLYKLASAAFKKAVTPTDVKSEDDLLDKFVQIVVKHSDPDSEGRIWANVETVFACKTDPTDWVSTYNPDAIPAKVRGESKSPSEEDYKKQFGVDS